MYTLKLTIQIGCLILLAAILGVLIRFTPAAQRAPPVSPPAINSQLSTLNYTYSEYVFTGPTAKELGKTLRAQLISYDLNTETLTTHPAETNAIHGADEILTAIGKDGWEYVWTDGKQYLVRRPSGAWHHTFFLIEYHEDPK